MAARLLPGGDAVVASFLRLRVELFMRGTGLESVGGGEVATFWFQVRTDLQTKETAGKKRRLLHMVIPAGSGLTDSLRTLWGRCRTAAADCPVLASGASPCPHDHSHSSNLSSTDCVMFYFHNRAINTFQKNILVHIINLSNFWLKLIALAPEQCSKRGSCSVGVA